MENIFETSKMLAINFSKWKDKEYPCKWFDKYGKHNEAQWLTIEELYDRFVDSECERLKKETQPLEKMKITE